MVNKKGNHEKVPVIDFSKCTRCMKCTEACPNKAIILSFNSSCAKCIKYCLTMKVPCRPKDIIFKYEHCDACGKCLEVCAENAMSWFKARRM